MKIRKNNKSVKASDELVAVIDVNDDQCCTGLPTEGTCCKYDEAICSIQVAIESLAAVAQDDQIAKDSIANLSVVLMDLKSNCCQ